MSRSTIFQIINFLSFFFLTNSYSLSKDFVEFGHNYKQPLKISAENMQIYYKKNLALLEGNIETIQGNLKIKSGKMKVNFASLKNKNWKINNIIYSEKVTIKSPKNDIKADMVSYNPLKNELLIEGNVTITKDNNQITSEKLTYDLRKDLIIMSGNQKNKTKAVINIE